MKSLIMLFLFAIIVFGLAFFLPKGKVVHPDISGPTPTPAPISSEKLMSVVNDWRQAQGLQIYKENELTCSFAQIRVKEIEINFSHDGFNGKRMCGNLECWASENLSQGFTTEKDTLNGWLNSPEHLKNLKADYYYSCIKCENNYCAQEFANL